MSVFHRRRRYEISHPELLRINEIVREETLRRGKGTVEPPFELLGLAETEDPLVAAVFERAGVDREALRRSVEAALPPRKEVELRPGDRERSLANSAGMIRAYHLAMEEAEELEHDRLCPEHLLVGLLREKGEAARLLRAAGLTLEAARAHLYLARSGAAG